MKLKIFIFICCISKVFLVFIETKHKTDLDATYFKLHLRHLFMLKGVAAFKLKGNLYFLIGLNTQSNKHIFWL